MGGGGEGFPSVIHFPPESMRRAVLQSGRQWVSQLSGWGLSAGVLRVPAALSRPIGRALEAFCVLLGCSWGQHQLETSLEPGGKGALLAQRTQARRKITYQAALSMLV